METTNSIYFWRENNKYGFLSNFYYSIFVDSCNVKYICSEQYFMAQKCLLFDKENTLLYKQIMETKIPYVIKRLGRQVKNFDQEKWDVEKYNIMKNALRYKFNQNKILRKKLLLTCDKNLYEASKFDKTWGIGIDCETAKDLDEKNYPGQNLLGKALMEIRKEIKQEIHKLNIKK